MKLKLLLAACVLLASACTARVGPLAVGGGNGGAGGGTSGMGGGTSGMGGGTSGTGGGTTTIAGFQPGPTGCQPQQLEADVSVGGYRSDRYAWSDSACLRRTAALVRNNAADPGGSRGGFLRELTLELNGAPRTARGTGSNGWNGWGYVVNHYSNTADISRNKTGTFRTVLAGAHHAIHEFKVQMNPGGPLAVTITWFFATGRSAPVFAVTFDSSGTAANTLNADSRTPYGDLAFEGTAGPIAGIAWGDLYRFTTTGSGPVTSASAWDYTQPNLVPFVRMWSSAVDAEMGAVQTQTFEQHVGGGDYGGGLLVNACHGKTSATKGANCSAANETMPQSWLWPFQLNQYELPFSTSSHRLAWGTNYGAIGRTSVTAFGKTFSGYPTLRYGVFMVVGARSTNDTLAQVTQVERLTAAAVTGAAWNPLYATFDATAATVTLDPKGAAIASPVFRFTAPQLTQVTLNGVPLTANAGYFATVDPATQSVWVTLNGTVTGPISLQVQ